MGHRVTESNDKARVCGFGQAGVEGSPRRWKLVSRRLGRSIGRRRGLLLGLNAMRRVAHLARAAHAGAILGLVTGAASAEALPPQFFAGGTVACIATGIVVGAVVSVFRELRHQSGGWRPNPPTDELADSHESQ
jgi:hypothetical protein